MPQSLQGVVVPSAGLPSSLSKGTSLVKFPKQTIGPQFTNKVIAWFEQFYFRMKRYPLTDEIMGHFKWTELEIERLNCSPFWLKCLDSRGITAPVASAAGSLSATQVATISLITNFSDRRSIPAKIQALGVTEEQLNGWYVNPEFQQEMALRTSVALDNSFPEVQASLMRQIQRGNFQAIKFYYEVTGRVQTPEQINVQLATSRLIEAVQKHVSDPEILQAIAKEVLS